MMKLIMAYTACDHDTELILNNNTSELSYLVIAETASRKLYFVSSPKCAAPLDKLYYIYVL